MRISSPRGISHRPPGFGPVLASARPVPRRQRLVIAVLGALFYAAVMAYVLWRGLSWRWAAATLGPTYALVVWMSYRNIVRAGEGWLSRGKKYVHTDRLTVLQAEGTLTGVRFMMRDADCRFLHLRPSDISGNPDVWQLARAGILASCSAGLTIDAPTSHYFALQGSLQVGQVPGIQLPWKPRGIRAGRWTEATGAPLKSCAARMTRSVAPRSGLWT
jgi:hypothetical protein